MQDNSKTSGGIGFCGLLAVLFVGLKLTGHIAWSWWWVLSPLWLPMATLVVVAFSLFIAFTIFEAMKKRSC